ncbi:MAG: divergent polysaccharide deacetylase family protein [Nitrospirota bacterium]
MAKARKRIKRKKHSRHIIFILALLVAGTLFILKDLGKDSTPPKKTKTSRPKIVLRPAPSVIPEKEDKPLLLVKPEPESGLPKIAIVIDDLGPNKKAAKNILSINAPITLSILPQEVYSAWVAEEGHRLGHDVIGHIPLQAKSSLKLGNGGLYLKMTKREIINTLKKNLNSIPHLTGISTHMGSAFTEDRRVMNVLILELKKRKLLFLDSFTTAKSLGLEIAKSENVRAIRRDVFLDDSNDPAAIKAQWKRLMKIVSKKGYAVAQGHPRKNTIEFLKKTLKNNNEVEIVPLSELINQK